MTHSSPKNRAEFEAAVALFHVACELEEQELRVFLHYACGGSSQLRSEVERLLAADRKFTGTEGEAFGARETGGACRDG